MITIHLLTKMKEENNMETKEAEKITEEFFKRRFPEKGIQFEKRCGYFGEWVERFKSGHPKTYMDSQSLKVWEEMLEENKNR